MPYVKPESAPVGTCQLCMQKGWKGNSCPTCGNYKRFHYVEGIGSKEGTANCFCIAESPLIPSVSADVTGHIGWSYDIEKSIQAICEGYIKTEKRFKGTSCRYTYAMHCEKDKPSNKEIVACSALFRQELDTYCVENKPIVILALGAAAVRLFDIKQSGYKKIQGKILTATFHNRTFYIIPTVSKRQILQNPGMLDILKKHTYLFLSTVCDVARSKPVAAMVPLSTLTAHHAYPRTLAEVKKITEEIINYAPECKHPDDTPISIDTETNTLYPHRTKLKLLTLVVSWEPKKAVSIPVEHPESPFKLVDVAPYIQAILSCAKPKILHNAKFDILVLRRKGWEINNIVWDTMVGEHLLEESKKGYYGLKELVRDYLPAYRDYEENVQQIAERKRTDIKDRELETDDDDAESEDLTDDTDNSKEEKEKEKDKDKEKEKIIKSPAEIRMLKDQGYEHVPLDVLNQYGALDADVTRQIAPMQTLRIREEQKKINNERNKSIGNPFCRGLVRPLTDAKEPLRDLMKYQMIPVVKTLANMESRGIRVDQEYVESLRHELSLSLQEILIAIYGMIPPGMEGPKFNPGSPQQLRDRLFASGYIHPTTGQLTCYKGKITPPKTSGGAYSTNAKFLRQLVTQRQCPFSKAILDYRAVLKIKNTFLENIKVLSSEDGRMHTTFHPQGTATGRLSSSQENMQNIPKQIGKHNIKRCFIPTDPDNDVFVQADAKAAEVRVYAAYSRDPNLIKALNDGLDPHSFFSSMVLNPQTLLKNIPHGARKQTLEVAGIDDVHGWTYSDFEDRKKFVGTKEFPGPDPIYGARLNKLRDNIKRVVFGILYGAYKTKIAGIVGISEEQAQAIIDSLFKMFPTIEKYLDNTKEQLRLMQMVETFFGRRRRFPNWEVMPSKMRKQAERKAINFKIQSTSSDIVMRTMVHVEEPLKRDFNAHLILTVHDSINWEMPKKYASQMSDFVNEYFVKFAADNYPWMPVPFKWDIEMGPSYGELISVDEYLAAQRKPVDLLQEEKNETEYLETEIRQELAAEN